MSVVSLVNQTVACHKFDHTGVFMAGRQGEVNPMSMLFNWNSFFRDYLLYKDKNATRKDKRGKCRINKDYSIKGKRNSGNTKGMKIGGKWVLGSLFTWHRSNQQSDIYQEVSSIHTKATFLSLAAAATLDQIIFLPMCDIWKIPDFCPHIAFVTSHASNNKQTCL